MKDRSPKKVTIGEYNFYIHPFGAMKAANISGEVLSVAAPIVTVAVSFMSGDDFMNMPATDAVNSLMPALSSISGDKIEKLLRLLLVDNRNVAYDTDENQKVEWLDGATVNDIFCMDMVGLYTLAYEVIKVNYGDFFTLISTRFGNTEELLKTTST